MKGKLRSKAKEKAETLLEPFKSVFSYYSFDEMPGFKPDIEDSNGDTNVNIEGVDRLLTERKPHKACKPNDIPF